MSKKVDEWTDMGKSLANEISGDAPIIASQLFGSAMPGVQATSDANAGRIIREAYQRGDRGFLHGLATQQPAQFLRVWKMLGGTIPPRPGQNPVSLPASGDPSSNVNAP